MWQSLTLLAAGEAGARIKSRAKVMALYAAAGVVGLAAVMFALAAVTVWLSRFISPLWATLAVAGALLVIALIIIAAARFERTRKSERAPLRTTALVAAPMMLQAASKRVSLTTVAAVAAILLGAIVGRKIASE